MKRIKTILFALMAMITVSVSAKELAPLEQPKFSDGLYIGAGVGYDWNVNEWHGNGATANFRVGKMIVPQFGLELEYNALFDDFYKKLPAGRVGMNAVLNLNTLGGYTGKHYILDVNPFLGLGWQRNYCDRSNDMYTKMGVHLNFNTSKHFAIVISPTLVYNLTNGPLQYDSRRADFGVEVGVQYTFGGFKLSNKKYTQAQYDEVLYELDRLGHENLRLQELANKPAVVSVVKEVITEKVETPIFPSIGFDCGSANILPTNQLNINEMASYINNLGGSYKIYGYASVEGPETLNNNLSLERAKNLKEALVTAGVDENKLQIEGCGPTEKFGGEYILNRVAIVEPVE